MRNLDEINLALLSPSRTTVWTSIFPLFSGLFSLALAGQTLSGPLWGNPFQIAGLVMFAAACLGFFVPWIFKWDWQAKFFGVSFIFLGTLSMICIVPFLLLVFYGEFWWVFRFLIFFLYFSMHIVWCRRFFVLYRNIADSNELFSILYVEDEDAVYYLQEVDRYLIDKVFKLRQIPPDLFFAVPMVIALSMSFAIEFVREVVGLSFVHIFMAIAGLPISLMCFGIAAKAVLVFYYYPMKIRSRTGKRVYVDMNTFPDNLSGTMRKWKGANLRK